MSRYREQKRNDKTDTWNYVIDPENKICYVRLTQFSDNTYAELEKNCQVAFRYTTPDGSNDDAGNPNGSMHNIAGICNRERNVAGLMPHPERAAESTLGSADGLVILRSMAEALVGAAKASA